MVIITTNNNGKILLTLLSIHFTFISLLLPTSFIPQLGPLLLDLVHPSNHGFLLRLTSFRILLLFLSVLCLVSLFQFLFLLSLFLLAFLRTIFRSFLSFLRSILCHQGHLHYCRYLIHVRQVLQLPFLLLLLPSYPSLYLFLIQHFPFLVPFLNVLLQSFI